MDGARDRKEQDAYTRRPAGPPAPRKPVARGDAVAAASAAVVVLLLAFGGLRRAAGPAAPAALPPAPPAAEAAAPVAPAPPAPVIAPLPRDFSSLSLVKGPDAPLPVAPPEGTAADRRGTTRWLNEGFFGPGKLPEPEDQVKSMSVFSDFFYAPMDGWPVAGNAVDVLVDGRAAKAPLQPAAEPGMTKAVVAVPLDGRPHTVVFMPTYDLGPDGLVTVREIIEQRRDGDRTYTVETPVDRAVFRSGMPRRNVKLKD